MKNWKDTKKQAKCAIACGSVILLTLSSLTGCAGNSEDAQQSAQISTTSASASTTDEVTVLDVSDLEHYLRERCRTLCCAG